MNPLTVRDVTGAEVRIDYSVEAQLKAVEVMDRGYDQNVLGGIIVLQALIALISESRVTVGDGQE